MFFFFSSRRRHTRCSRDWSSDVCSSDLVNDGPREVAWDGLLADRHLAPPGRYELRVTGNSQLLRRADSAVIYFEIRHEVAPLEDTLPELTARDLLPEQFSRSAATRDLLRGLVVAGGAPPISHVLARRPPGGRPEPRPAGGGR